MNISVSVIIPFYRTPPALFARCVLSVLQDDTQDVEVLVINDGSPREYDEELRMFEKDNRVRIINLPHGGVSIARNTGIREARGKWITFVDADDHLDSDAFRRILKNVDQFTGDVEIFSGGMYDRGVTHANVDFLKENYDYGATQEDKISVMESALSVGYLPRGYIQYFTYGSACCKLINREFLIRNHLAFDESVAFAEDVLFMLQVYQKASSIFFHGWYLYNYVHNPESATRKYRPGMSADVDVFFMQLEKFIKENQLEEGLERAFYLRAQYEAKRCFCQEYFNHECKDPDAKKKYMQFISKEPYHTACEKDYFPKVNRKQYYIFKMVKYGWGNSFRLYVRFLEVKGKWMHDFKQWRSAH